MESLVSYLVAAMLAWVPLHAHASFESSDHVLARYQSIARDVVSVALDESEAPVFEGPDNRTQTALLMLAVASYESSFNKRVDDGTRRGDNGHSYCLMQVHVGQGATREGWNARQLIEDRKLCFRAALHILQASFAACRKLPFDDRLSAYASGHCFADAVISRSRVWRARAWWEAHAPPRELASET
ncbi:MAG TPA: hypothetical protein VN894_18880 [Polyangiaceae bacterium]|nr:hypothetical protein [Polyangiaceae bacterium]